MASGRRLNKLNLRIEIAQNVEAMSNFRHGYQNQVQNIDGAIISLIEWSREANE